jgi:hypothetical protein
VDGIEVKTEEDLFVSRRYSVHQLCKGQKRNVYIVVGGGGGELTRIDNFGDLTCRWENSVNTDLK